MSDVKLHTWCGVPACSCIPALLGINTAAFGNLLVHPARGVTALLFVLLQLGLYLCFH